jgi:hypothetical protein
VTAAATAVAWGEVADLLDTAGDELERRGWCQGVDGDDGSDPDGCRVCLDGALYAATTGSPFPDPADFHTGNVGLRCEARQVLREVIGLPFPEPLTSWNDQPGRTAEQVIAAVRQAARVARGRAA